MKAAREGHADIVKILLDKNAGVNEKDSVSISLRCHVLSWRYPAHNLLLPGPALCVACVHACAHLHVYIASLLLVDVGFLYIWYFVCLWNVLGLMFCCVSCLLHFSYFSVLCVLICVCLYEWLSACILFSLSFSASVIERQRQRDRQLQNACEYLCVNKKRD